MTQSEGMVPGEGGAQQLHPLTLAFAALSVARRMILPAVIAGVSAGREAPGSILLWIVAIMSVPALLYSVAKFLSFRYTMGPEELVIRSGILRRHHRVIPLSRVQNIELRQGALQQLLGVAELRVETAGTAGEAEADLSVLGRAEAESLRVELLARRHRSVAAPDSAGPQDTRAVTTLSRLGTSDLVVAGATANEAGIIAAALFGALQFLDPFAERLIGQLAFVELPAAGAAVLILAVALLAFVVLGWLFSVVGSVIKYYGFTLERSNGELRKRFGFFNRREAAIPIERVQALRVEESLLRRPLGLAALKVATAAGPVGERQRGGAEAYVPIARQRELSGLVAGVFPDLEFARLQFQKVHPRSRRRAFLRYTALLVVTAGALAAIFEPEWLWLLLMTPLLYGVSAWQYRNRGFALAPGFVAARNGILNRITWIVPDHKLQTVLTSQTPFQRRHGLASVVIDTAGGGRQATVIDLAYEDARRLEEELMRRLLDALRRMAERRASARAAAGVG